MDDAVPVPTPEPSTLRAPAPDSTIGVPGEPDAEPATEPAAEPAAEPVAEPGAEPDAEPGPPPEADADTPLAQAVAQTLLLRQGLQRSASLPRPPGTRVLVVANQKGGVGKTTTAVNLAVALAQGGLRVLLIDLDPQGNASTALGIDHDRDTPSIYDALVDGVPLAEVIQQSPEAPGLYAVPATIDLAGAEIELVSVVARENRLLRVLTGHPAIRRSSESGAAADLDADGLGTGAGGPDGGIAGAQGLDADRFDYVLIDCPPSLGLLTLNALVAADELFLPIQAEYYALEGVGQLVETVELVRANLNAALHISTVLLTMYDGRTRLAAAVADEVRGHFGDQVLRTAIPRSVRISEAPSYGQSVLTYDPASPGALSYREAARELAHHLPVGVPR